MAETKLEREYVIPLRREWTKVPSYKRTAKSITAIKEFIAKHMKVANRDVDKVKIDSYLNNDIWFRGAGTPPARVRVKAIKEGEIVRVTFAADPEHVKFARERHSRKHFKTDKKVTAPVEKKEDVKTEEERKVESEKEKSVAAANEKLAEQQAKMLKHVVKNKKAQKAPLQRMALQK
ncbi:MAG: 50S ribosomal protein L31e [Nanoarchaeota archaeon]